jgi:hypothetical protein
MSTQPTDAEIDEFLDSPGNINWVLADKRERFRLFARAVLAKWGTQQPAHSGEPVAWAFKYDDGTWHDPSTTEHSSGMRPLFEASQPVERVQLTDEQVAEGFATRSRHMGLFRGGVRFAEQHHGIKGGQHGADT